MKLCALLAAGVLAAALAPAPRALAQAPAAQDEPTPSQPSSATPPQRSPLSQQQIDELERQNAKAQTENVLIAQAQAAMAAKNWQAAVEPLTELTAAEPSNWRFLGALGDVQLNLANYDAAIAAYQKGVAAAQGAADDAKAKAGEARMLTNLGNAELKLHRTADAVAAFRQAASLDPNPAVAWFNLCATEYNTGDVAGALDACDKAISADPARADAWFIKGSLLLGEAKTDGHGAIIAPPGCAEALRKYLELAPDGPHAGDVKQMLAAIGQKAAS